MTAAIFGRKAVETESEQEQRSARPAPKFTYAGRRQVRPQPPAPAQVTDASAVPAPQTSFFKRAIEESDGQDVNPSPKRPRAGTITAFFRPVIELSSGPAQSSCSLGSSNPPASPAPDTRKTTRPPAPPRPATYEQLHLDLGQKDAVVTRCPECGMEYSKAKLEDDALHAKYHRSVVQGVEWQGYKGEVEACQYQDGSRVIIVDADVCSVFVRKKANEILSIVNSELGSAEMDPEPGSMIFLLVSRAKRVTGCVVAQPVKKAFRVVPDATDTGTRIDGGCNATQTNGSVQCRSDQPVPASCGISRIWVLKSERRKGAGAKLLSTVCANFLFGCTLGPSDLAFTEPTLVGKALAQRFCGRDDFLVY